MMRLLEMHHLFALNTSSVLLEQMMCFFISYLIRRRTGEYR